MEEVNEIKQRKHAEFADYREYKLKTKYDLKYYHEIVIYAKRKHMIGF